ncbi:MAG: hypothetical protein GY856_39350 [bacterium]|nr:hypothetical protein [bacterium]
MQHEGQAPPRRGDDGDRIGTAHGWRRQELVQAHVAGGVVRGVTPFADELVPFGRRQQGQLRQACVR